MAKWRLQTVGKLCLTQDNDADDVAADEITDNIAEEACAGFGFRNRSTLVLLASLATDPGTCQREALAQRLWEASSPAASLRKTSQTSHLTKLRPILSDLVNGKNGTKNPGIGRESLLYGLGTIQLKPGIVITDMQEADALYRKAKATLNRMTGTEQRCIDQRCIEQLRGAARLLQGSFLPGYDPPQAALAWYDIQTMRLERLRYEIWELLFQTAQDCGDSVTVAEAWQQLRGIEVPLDIDVGTKEPGSVARSSRIARSRRVSRSGKTRVSTSTISWTALLPHLERQERNGISLSVREENALLDSLNRRLSSLPKQCAGAFRALSVFPQPFTAHQAGSVVSVTVGTAVEETIDRLVKASLLRTVRSDSVPQGTEHGGEVRYALPPFVAPLLFQKLSSEQRKRFKARHAKYFAAFDGQGWPATADGLADRERLQQWVLAEQENFLQALETCLEAPLTEETMEFVASLDRSMFLSSSDNSALLRRTILRRAAPRLREAAGSGRFFSHCPAMLLCHAAQVEQDFPAMICWANVALDWVKTHGEQSIIPSDAGGLALALGYMLQYLLQATHHAGRHDEFDRAKAIAWRLLPEITDGEGTDAGVVGLPHLQFRRIIHQNTAENYWARGDLESAFKASNGALSDLKAIVPHHPVSERHFAETHYQRGCIQWDRGQQSEALSAWNDALQGFGEMNERHGIADCKKRLGHALATMGQFALGQDLVREAIAIYAALENEASRAAAVGTLADVMAMRGKTDDARRYYEEALAYWRTARHASWIHRFETALARLPQKAQIG